MKSSLLNLSIFAIFLINVGNSVLVQAGCEEHESCEECYRTFECAWCLKDNSIGSCVGIHDKTCPENDKIKPVLNYEVTRNDDFTDEIRLRPQEAKLTLGVGQSKRFTISHKVPKDYKLDLYYLMDMSNSMMDDKAQLMSVGGDLVEKMKSLTQEFRIGFGAFMDKPTLPYADQNGRPCGDSCIKTYSYKNHLSLTDKTENFVNEVNSSQIASNLDTPEGGLDALMQAMVCKKDIGWRDGAMHIILYASDQIFHHAGNGLLSGIYTPNDMECHLVDNSYPTDYSLTTDYPSLGQIKEKSDAEDIGIIFAVPQIVASIYKDVAGLLGPRVDTRILSHNSSNIVQVIVDAYEDISKSIVMLYDNTGNVEDYFEIKITNNCNSGTRSKTSVCEGSNLSETIIDFYVDVKLKKCPLPDEDFPKTLVFKIKQISKNVTVNIIPDCECECENKITTNSSLCSYNGNSSCGECHCIEGFWGTKCSCDIEAIAEKECDITPSGQICSGRGKCLCGDCVCDDTDKYAGDNCECDRTKCPMKDGQRCNDHGTCDCENCNCEDGWSGDDCGCSTNITTCLNPDNGDICSNNGECICGKCECGEKDGEEYHGDYCEDCDSCTGYCKDYLDCAICIQRSEGDCKDACGTIHISEQDDTDKLEGKNCNGKDSKNCIVRYSYYTDNNNTTLYVIKIPECTGLSTLEIIIISISSVVAFALILLSIWKFVVTYKDRKEYANFEKQKNSEALNTYTNKLYKPATTTIQNPMHQKTN